jgi:hypothetical protein
MGALSYYWRWRIESHFKLLKLTDLLLAIGGRFINRQMKRKRPFTGPALLAGLRVLLAMLDVLDHYPIPDLRRVAAVCFPVLKQIGFL